LRQDEGKSSHCHWSGCGLRQGGDCATPVELKFSTREVTAWGRLALLKRMLDGLDFRTGIKSWQLPAPGSNRGYAPEQLIEQMIVSIWCGAARFAQADITRLDATLVRLFDWGKAAGNKAIVRLFQRCDQADSACGLVLSSGCSLTAWAVLLLMMWGLAIDFAMVVDPSWAYG